MKKISTLILLGTLVLHIPMARAVSGPDWNVTPGELCQSSDADFSGYDYPEQVARCRRNVSHDEKLKVAALYGVPQSDWPNYEFDHLIPLCAGGSNSIRNLWPQPHPESTDKDKLEDHVCQQMKAGNLSQSDAVQQIRDWFDSRFGHGHPAVPLPAN